MPRTTKPTAVKQIVAEQIRLLKTEKEILSLLQKLNSQLNELVVEELQLKSNEIANESLVTEIDIKPTHAEIVASFDSQLVNQQKLDESLLNCDNNQMEEDDDEYTILGQTSTTDYRTASSIYDFTVKDSFGNDVKLDKYKDNVVMVVNIASQCGLTKKNYAQLTELKRKYNDLGFRILSFPCNQFGSQSSEKDGEEMICHLKDANADVGDVMKKVNVNGDDAEPLYKFLKSKQGGTLGNAIKWNFTKFLIDKKGQPVNRFAPTTNPIDISDKIEKLLKE